MTNSALRDAIESVLACPLCKAELVLEDALGRLRCTGCQGTYQVSDGIPTFLQGQTVIQEEEKQSRDALAAEYSYRDRQALMDLIGQHHCLSLMRKQAEEFRARFKPDEWILDIGIGNGWQWTGDGGGARVLGIDMSLGNLALARRLLGDRRHDVVLVCADAAALPVRDHAIAGVWSVQVFQHFPQNVLRSVQSELNRVLGDEFVMEMHNLNPAVLHRLIYRLFGKRFHCRGRLGPKELNRLSGREWTDIWRRFRGGRAQVSYGYSELFFHPDFRLRPRHYPMKLEQALARHAPGVASLFARQVRVSVSAGRL